MEVVFHENLSSDDEVIPEEVKDDDAKAGDDNDVENQILASDGAESVSEESIVLQQQNTTGCCSPYAAIFLVLVYVVTCFLFAQPNAAACEEAQEECEASFWSSAFALDFFICAVTIVLTIHLWLVGRNETACLAFACLAFGFLVRGVLIKDAINKGYDVVHGQREFYIATLAYYVLWTISAAFFHVLVAQAWQRLVNKPKRYGAVESKLMLVFLIFAASIVVIGGIFGAIGTADIMILNIGRIAWHVAYFVFFLGASVMWTRLASEQTVRIWGLPNSVAGKLLIASLLLMCASWVVEMTWDDTLGSACFVLSAYLGILLTVFFTHNVILSVICPFEIFIDEDELSRMMSEQTQARDFASSIQKPTSRSPFWKRKAKSGGNSDEEIPDTESSSYADSDFGETGVANEAPSSKPRNFLMFFSMFRARGGRSREASSSEQDGPQTQQSTHEAWNTRELKMMSPDDLKRPSCHSGLVENAVLSASNTKQQSEILREKFSCESSVSSSGTAKNVACMPTCGIAGWTLASHSLSKRRNKSQALEQEEKAVNLARQLKAAETGDVKVESETHADDGDSDSKDDGFYAWIVSLLPMMVFAERQQNTNVAQNSDEEVAKRELCDVESNNPENDSQRSKSSRSSVLIPEVLTINKSSIDDDTASVVSQLTTTAESKKSRLSENVSVQRIRQSRKGRSLASFSSEATSLDDASARTPVQSRTISGPLGKYKNMLRRTYGASKARSQSTRGSSADFSASRLESEASISLAISEAPSSTCDDQEDGIEISTKDHATLLDQDKDATLDSPNRRRSIKIPPFWPKTKSKAKQLVPEEHEERSVLTQSSQQDQQLGAGTSNLSRSLSAKSNHIDQSSQEVETPHETMEDGDAQNVIPILTFIESEPTEKTVESKVMREQSMKSETTSTSEAADSSRAISWDEDAEELRAEAIETSLSTKLQDEISPVSLLDDLSVHMYMTETEDEGEESTVSLWKEKCSEFEESCTNVEDSSGGDNLNDLSVHMHMTETEDEGDDSAVNMWKKRDSQVEEPAVNERQPEKLDGATVNATILDEIESSGSEGDNESEHDTGDAKDQNLAPDLSLLETQSESDNSSFAASGASSMLSTSTSGESDDFLNKMLDTLMASTSEDTNTTGESISRNVSNDCSESEGAGKNFCRDPVDRSKRSSCVPDEDPEETLPRSTTEEKVGIALMRSLAATDVSTTTDEKETKETAPLSPDATKAVAGGATASLQTDPSADRLEKAPPVESSSRKKSTGEDGSQDLQRDPISCANELVKSNSNDRRAAESSSSLPEQELDKLIEATSRSSCDASSFPIVPSNEKKAAILQSNGGTKRRRGSRKLFRRSSSSLSRLLTTIPEDEDGISPEATHLSDRVEI